MWPSLSFRVSGVGASGPQLRDGFLDLADFFRGLAADWRDWTVRRWESIEGDLRIEARHKYGHVQLRVTLRRAQADWGNDGWTANWGSDDRARSATDRDRSGRETPLGWLVLVVRSSHSPPF